MTIFHYSALAAWTLAFGAEATAGQDYSHNPPLRQMSEGREVIESCSNGYKIEGELTSGRQVSKELDKLKCNLLIRSTIGTHEDLVALKLLKRQFCIPLDRSLNQLAVDILYEAEGSSNEKLTATAIILTGLKRSYACPA
jgi:hypothetical protein